MIYSKSEIREMNRCGKIFKFESKWCVKYGGWCIRVDTRNGGVFYVGSNNNKIKVYKNINKAIHTIEHHLVVR